MNARGHYGHGPAHASMAYVGHEAPKSGDSSTPGGGALVAAALLVGGAVLGLRWAFREMTADEREIRHVEEWQKLINMPQEDFNARAREIGLRPGMSQAAKDQALDAYLAKKDR
jgi:hypothetical protein